MLYKKGRGAQINTHNKFEKHTYQAEGEYLEFLRVNGEDTSLEQKTQFIEVYPKTIVNQVKSPDVGMEWSMNPYQAVSTDARIAMPVIHMNIGDIVLAVSLNRSFS